MKNLKKNFKLKTRKVTVLTINYFKYRVDRHYLQRFTDTFNNF